MNLIFIACISTIYHIITSYNIINEIKSIELLEHATWTNRGKNHNISPKKMKNQ